MSADPTSPSVEPEDIPAKRCGKRVYISKKHAITAAKDVSISKTGTMRAYQCPICDGGVWHLSSKITHEEFRKRMKEQRDHRAACRRRAVLERLRLEDEKE